MKAQNRRRAAAAEAKERPALVPPPLWVIEVPEAGYDDDQGTSRALAELGLVAPPGVPPLVVVLSNPDVKAPRLWDGDIEKVFAAYDVGEPEEGTYSLAGSTEM